MVRIDYKPLGTVVRLKGSVKKFVIVSRGLRVNLDNETKHYDYGACPYPEGIINEKLFYFNDDKIMDVVFEGFSDEDDKIMVDQINIAIKEN